MTRDDDVTATTEPAAETETAPTSTEQAVAEQTDLPIDDPHYGPGANLPAAAPEAGEAQASGQTGGAPAADEQPGEVLGEANLPQNIHWGPTGTIGRVVSDFEYHVVGGTKQARAGDIVDFVDGEMQFTPIERYFSAENVTIHEGGTLVAGA